MGGGVEWRVDRVQVHPPTAGTQHLTAPIAGCQLPFLPRKNHVWKEGGGVVLSIHGDRFRVFSVAPRHPATDS